MRSQTERRRARALPTVQRRDGDRSLLTSVQVSRSTSFSRSTMSCRARALPRSGLLGTVGGQVADDDMVSSASKCRLGFARSDARLHVASGSLTTSEMQRAKNLTPASSWARLEQRFRSTPSGVAIAAAVGCPPPSGAAGRHRPSARIHLLKLRPEQPGHHLHAAAAGGTPPSPDDDGKSWPSRQPQTRRERKHGCNRSTITAPVLGLLNAEQRGAIAAAVGLELVGDVLARNVDVGEEAAVTAGLRRFRPCRSP